MSAIEETVCMMESMTMESRIRVMMFARELLASQSSDTLFAPLTAEQILADCEKSEKEYAEGRGMDAHEAVQRIRGELGFV